MPSSDFLTYATAGGANVEDQASYAADAKRTNGQQSGTADSANFNKAMRQATFMAAMLGQFMLAQTAADVPDDGDLTAMLARFEASLGDFIGGAASIESWTPVLVPSAGSVSAYTLQHGRSIKIGNVVFFQCQITLNGVTGVSGASAYISGLLHAAASFSQPQFCSWGAFDLTAYTPTGALISAIVQSGTTHITLEVIDQTGVNVVVGAGLENTSNINIGGWYIAA